jgi:hypothetical protein
MLTTTTTPAKAVSGTKAGLPNQLRIISLALCHGKKLSCLRYY